jgi:hypothetical protein
MDVEFVTDHDTEEAFLGWCARRRAEVVSPAVFLLVGNVFVFTDLHSFANESRTSWLAVGAIALQIVAFGIAVVARDADHPHEWPTPHAELVSLGFLACSLLVLFDVRTSVLVFLLFALVVAAIAALLVRGWHGFRFLRGVVPYHGRAEHVHVGANGMEVTVRPNPRPRVIAWSKIRYLGADARTLFVVAGSVPVIVPRRAFASEHDWDAFVDLVARYSEAALKSASRAPMWRHVRSPKARRA